MRKAYIARIKELSVENKSLLDMNADLKERLRSSQLEFHRVCDIAVERRMALDDLRTRFHELGASPTGHSTVYMTPPAEPTRLEIQESIVDALQKKVTLSVEAGYSESYLHSLGTAVKILHEMERGAS